MTVCSKCQIDGEDFVKFCGLLRKHELYAILISLKSMTIFNNTSVDFVSMSADVLLKMVIVLSEMRIGSCNCVLKINGL